MTDDVLFETRGRLGLITLNRPKALNALNRAMCNAIYTQLGEWADDDGVNVVAITGSGEKAFCAGGDVVGLYNGRGDGSSDWEDFFGDEYRMNHRIGTFEKPYVAIIDGITMGGGVGLSIHAPYRIATERTLFAMPETGIGLIPDVGGTHALSHMPGEIGTYLGLTGARLKAEDCLYAGIATHYTQSGNVEGLITALASDVDSVTDVMVQFERPPGQPPALKTHRESIDRHFAKTSVEEIMASLSMGDDWAEAQRDLLMRMSPTSMKITLRALREGADDDLAGCLKREYRLVGNIKAGHDFYEGIRAQLIDKDRKPRWNPSNLRDVTADMVDSYFAVPPHGDLRL
ncbi:enoyl-CoA hydratase/isomerase family protein [Pacificimonas sp. WHA3]|uniref:Enoyl-CoA hydratase/isomerase family protein n=1 Tax=Pacificimonas pallii TaxID=2827236 RepID=A0ABS6SID4_9SPHN|nr:enoyl-CoA hydratase/isomerase family protein [Pacificimonas pallii]MBV7257686.1 enoyl-CoA hydratase/isomerase family protein [Pacificimonas pallii]